MTDTKKEEIAFQRKLAALGKLEEFDAKTFAADDKCSQAVCSFVLALAVIHNDLNDLDLVTALLQNAKPTSPAVVSPEWGFYHAVEIHIAKQRLLVVHELLELIRENPKALVDPVFESLVKQLPKEARQAWQNIREVGQGHANDTDLGKFLHRSRNHIAAHYAPKVIFNGYSKRFLSGSGERPMLSRGAALLNTRFYFADAAVQDVISGGSQTAIARKVLFEDAKLWESIYRALYYVVVGFINSRSAFRSAANANKPFVELYKK